VAVLGGERGQAQRHEKLAGAFLGVNHRRRVPRAVQAEVEVAFSVLLEELERVVGLARERRIRSGHGG
jgi:hypothetical protein